MKFDYLYLALLVVFLVCPVQAVTWTSASGCWTATDGAYSLVMWNSTGVTTWTAPAGVSSVEYLVVAGGGSGAVLQTSGGGGGGAGGISNATGLAVTAGTSYNVTVGAGGAQVVSSGEGLNGQGSRFSSITTTGGYGGSSSSPYNGGASGGGNAGGAGSAVNANGGGGGGAGSVGGNAGPNYYIAGGGGSGLSYYITGSATILGGGGGGGAKIQDVAPLGQGGGGGSGIGGDGISSKNGNHATDGAASTGSGGGGAAWNAPYSSVHSGAGASGLVIIRYSISDPPTVTTQATGSIAGTTATGYGTIVDIGSASPTHRGVCWNIVGTPTTADSKVDETGTFGTGAFSESITGLTKGQKYYLRAYATNTDGTAYGEEVNFTTLIEPTVTTQAATVILSTSATGNGNIISIGGVNATVRGICWNTVGTPTIADSKAEESGSFGTGAFTEPITGLTTGTPYFARAYATNSVGTSYGAEITFTPANIVVTTDTTTDIYETSATGHGNITTISASAPTVRGFAYGIGANPTIAGDHVQETGTYGVGAYSLGISGLSASTTYHIRAFATNDEGTVYGADDTFLTTTPLPTSDRIGFGATANQTGIQGSNGFNNGLYSYNGVTESTVGTAYADDFATNTSFRYMPMHYTTTGTVVAGTDQVSGGKLTVTDGTYLTVVTRLKSYKFGGGEYEMSFDNNDDGGSATDLNGMVIGMQDLDNFYRIVVGNDTVNGMSNISIQKKIAGTYTVVNTTGTNVTYTRSNKTWMKVKFDPNQGILNAWLRDDAGSYTDAPTVIGYVAGTMSYGYFGFYSMVGTAGAGNLNVDYDDLTISAEVETGFTNIPQTEAGFVFSDDFLVDDSGRYTITMGSLHGYDINSTYPGKLQIYGRAAASGVFTTPSYVTESITEFDFKVEVAYVSGSSGRVYLPGGYYLKFPFNNGGTSSAMQLFDSGHNAVGGASTVAINAEKHYIITVTNSSITVNYDGSDVITQPGLTISPSKISLALYTGGAGSTNNRITFDNLAITGSRYYMKPMLRNAAIGEYYNGTATVRATRYTDDFNFPTSSEYTLGSSATIDNTQARLELKGADATYLNNAAMSTGHYAFLLKRSTGATDVFNVKIANNDITVTGNGVVTVGGTAYTGTALTSPVWVEFVATGTQIAAYSNGVLIGTKTGLTLTPTTVQMSRTTENVYVYNWYVDGLESTSPSGINAGIDSVAHGAMYDTSNTASIEGYAPMTVQFKDVSGQYQPINPTLTRNWTYQGIVAGNNTQKTFATSSAPYAVFGEGNWSIKLNNEDIVGTYESPQTFWINLTPSSIASFTTDKTSGVTPLTVTVTDTSTNSPTSYLWYVDETPYTTSTIAPQTFVSVGTHKINLTVSNPSLSPFISTYSKNIYVNQTSGVDFNGTPTSGYAVSDVVFVDMSTGSGLSAWLWDFGDGGTSTIRNTTHTYTAPGNYTVSLTVTGLDGQYTKTMPNYITMAVAPNINSESTLQFKADPNIIRNLSVYTRTIQTDHIQNASFISGTTLFDNDNIMITSVAVNATTYADLVLTSYSINNSTGVISFNISRTGNFFDSIVTPTSIIDIGMLYDRYKSGVTGAGWGSGVLGNYTYLSTSPVTHLIDSPLTYSWTTFSDFDIANSTPTSGVTIVTFTPVEYTYMADRFLWDFGDGTTFLDHNGTAVNHIYTLVGPVITYSPSLTAYLSVNTSVTNTTTKTVSPVYPTEWVKANFTATKTNVGSAEVVNFIDASEFGNVTAIKIYNWSFGDGAFSSTVGDVNHVYAYYGIYTVALTVSNNNDPALGNSTLTRTDYIQVSADTEGTNLNVLYPREVQFSLVDTFGNSLSGVGVAIAMSNSTIDNTNWLTTLFGVSTDATPLDTTILTGTSDDEGSITFPLIASGKYTMAFNSTSRGISETKTVYPQQLNYVMVLHPDATLIPNRNNYINGTLYVTTPNESYADLRFAYTDLSATTTSISFYVDYSNRTRFDTQTFTGVYNATAYTSVPNVASASYVFGYFANTTMFGNVSASQGIMMKGVTGKLINLDPCGGYARGWGSQC